MKASLAFLFLSWSTLGIAAPPHAPWPGGIGVVPLPGPERPAVSVAGHPGLVLRDGDGWLAIVGIPLDADTDQPFAISVERAGTANETITIDLEPADYRVQRLNVDRKYVDPGEEALERIFRERDIIDRALGNWRAEAPDGVDLEAPVPGKRSSSFGSRRIFNDQPRSPHKGMDISAATGTPIRAPAAGIVTATGDFYFNGNTVILDHGQGFVSLYCHLSRIAVSEGDTVAAGDLLGDVGATGRVTGAHLHFATYLNATAVDPGLLLTAP